MVLDGSANIYVVGGTRGALPGQTSSGLEDAFLRKYDSSGNVLSTSQFGTSSSESASAVGLDGGGNVYVVGTTSGTLPGQTSSGGNDAFVRKYDSLGNVLWTHQFGTSAIESAPAIAVDGSGNVYVVGTTTGTLPGQTAAGFKDVFIRKYEGSGNVLWTRQFGTDGADWVEFGSVDVDVNGNVYVVGLAGGAFPGQTSSGLDDAFLRKYDSAGNILMTLQFGTSSSDVASGVGVDGNGECIDRSRCATSRRLRFGE